MFGSCRRSYCGVLEHLTKVANRKKLDFSKLQNISKVPDSICCNTYKSNEVTITHKNLQLLERLSLVNLDGKEALTTLCSSIQFAENIETVDTSNTVPLYTVLCEQHLQLRRDSVTEGNCREDILCNAKVTDEDYFISPPGNIALQQDVLN